MSLNRIKLEGVVAAVRSWASDWGGLLTMAMAIFSVCYVFWIYLLHPSEEHKTLVTDIVQSIFSLGMTILAWRASRQPALNLRKRRVWQLFTIAFFMYFVGNVVWAYYDLGVGEGLAVTWADVPYLMYYPICLAGLLMFPSGRAGRSRLTFGLDAGTVMLSATIVIWYLVLRPVALAQHVSSLETVITLAYPVGNTVLLFGVIALLLRRPSRKVSGALAILTIAIFFDAVADFGYSYQTLENSYLGGEWPDCFYMLGFTLMAVSAQYQYRMARTPATEPSAVGAEKSPFSWLPYAAVAVAYGLLLYVAFQHQHGMEPIVWLIAGAFLITGLVVVRQIVALRENSRLLAEKAARESEAHLAALVEHSSDIITIIDRDGVALYMSPCSERILGYPAHRLLGARLREYLHPDDEQRVMDAVAAIAEEPGKTGSLEMRSRHRDGHWIHLEAVVTNLLHEPSVAGIVINSRNITDRKKAEESLRESEEKLRQSQKMEAVGHLANCVAHDFRNLLAVIIGYADLLLREQPPDGNEQTIRQIGEIKKAGHRGESLTSQLLAFSLYLPPVDNPDAPAETLVDSADKRNGHKTVLLVEGEEAVRHMAQEILRLNGYEVLDASNGNEAIRLTEEYAGVIDLMVTDVVMPELGGCELAETLALTRPDMRVLFVSGSGDDVIVHHGVFDGRAAFLEKPFAPEALALKAREVLAV